MIDITPFTDEQWWKLCDCHASLPVPLKEADLTKPFVYDRKWGLFYVPMGQHILTMGTLLAFHHDVLTVQALSKKLSLDLDFYSAADYWLENTQGTAFKSSTSPEIKIGKMRNLSIFERRIFVNVTEVF